MKSKPVLFYVSGHGYGHSTRMIEVMKALLAEDSTIKPIIKTDAPKWLYDLDLPEGTFEFHHLQIDVGVVQRDSFTVNKRATLRKYADLVQRKPALVVAEAEFVKTKNVQLIVGDIPPFAFDIAYQAGIPSIAISNFSWDWIYRPFIQDHPEFSYLINDIQTSYAKAHLLLRLPFHGDMSAFPTIEDMPLIARRAAKTRHETLQAAGIQPAPDQKVVLVALRLEDLQRINFERLSKLREFLFISVYDLGPHLVTGNHPNIIKIPPHTVKFQDLVSASDAVISKPGYGIVAECIANKTPLLYTTRDDFLEYGVLVDSLESFIPCQCITREEFFEGNWEGYLTRLTATQPHLRSLALNGASFTAERILQRL